MATITQEIASFKAEFEQLLNTWNTLSTQARRREWNSYQDAIDQGDAGWMKFHLVLDSPATYGFDPTEGLRMGEFGVVPAREEAPA